MLLNILQTISWIAAIFAAIAAWLALYPRVISPFVKRQMGAISNLTPTEATYLKSLILSLEDANKANRWSNELYIDVDTELVEPSLSESIAPAYYLVKSISQKYRDQEFNNLSNIEKIESSQGTNFTSFEQALREVQGNSVVVIAPPGNSKTVSLRNYSIKLAKERLRTKNNLIPIFINLGYYTGFNADGSIQEFEDFLNNYFSRSSSFEKFLSNSNWENLLLNSRCMFFWMQSMSFRGRPASMKPGQNRWQNSSKSGPKPGLYFLVGNWIIIATYHSNKFS